MIPAPKRCWCFTLRTLFVMVTVACLAAATWRAIPRTVTFEETAHIKIGMTQDQVRELIGEPAFTYQNRNLVWVYREAIILHRFCVEFDDAGLVIFLWS
jgi:outer membrane protein assembly factor BamE (lipoprotein component of BamABCDE complex)